jgi:HD-GYP domain-containing protein (c-di-GMP phosphodiesterase class II)
MIVLADKTTIRLRVFIVGLALAAAGGLVLSVRAQPTRVSSALIVLAILTAVADSLAVEMQQGGVMSVAYPLSSATIILFGPTAGAIVAGLSCIPSAISREDRSWEKAIFNVSQLVLAALVAGWTYWALGGWRLSEDLLSTDNFTHAVLPVLGLAIGAVAVNTGLVSMAISLSTGAPFKNVWQLNYAWTTSTQIALTFVGLVIAQVTASDGMVGLFLFVVPLLIARQFYQRYTGLRSTYAGTVRSLVAVIEAKDPYTRGHSERVASYATAIAGALGLRPTHIEQIELAALLHDLGKVGVSRRILVKDGQLDSEEFSEIERHPAIGAHIIESVPFLADLAPLVLHHHERPDGTGYGEGLSGDEIPVEARILAVADCYDAMTSTRPYRAALTKSAAAAELARGAGSQFDPAAVGALLGWLGSAEESAQYPGLADVGDST